MAIATAIGSIIGAVSTVAATVMQMQVANMNADIEEQNAKRRIEYAQLDAQESDFQARAMLGEQIAAQAGSGVAVETGSTKAVRQVSRRLARLDALNIRQAGELDAYNHRVKAANYKAQGKVDAISGFGSALGQFMSAGSAISNVRPTRSKNYYPPAPAPRGVLF